MPKLGDKVRFSQHYEKSGEYFDSEDAESWTPEQAELMDNDQPVPVRRVKAVDNPPMAGFVCGVRNIAHETNIGPWHYTEYCGPSCDRSTTLRKVYLVAVNLTGFYKVDPLWIEEA